MSLLDISGLSLSIGALPILRDVTLSIAAGEILAVTGESGSGKSMTALAVMRLLPQVAKTRGAIYLEETELCALSEDDMCRRRGRDIGMVFQEPMTALNPVMTIGAQVMETIQIHTDMTRAEAEVEAARVLTRVGLPPDRFALDRYPHELSGGQRQRVVIAMAIALRPKLLIADEPTTALDVTTQAQILDLLRDLVRETGMGLMIITHDLAVVAGLADRIVVMRNGEVVERGPTMSVLTHQRHPYTRMLFQASRHRVTLPAARQARSPLLEVRHAVRDYPTARPHLFAKHGRFRAVNDVSFTLHRGERLGLVGESGCGKSTLTRAILGLEGLQGGELLLNGQPLSQKRSPAERQAMQVVFQDPFGSFNPRHRVERLITEPFHSAADAPTGRNREDMVAQVLSDVGLRPEDAQKYPHQFSGGQRQRIAIARALITRPELILFDEAVSALDVSVRARILDLIADLCRAYGLTYLFISHDLSVVREICDRVLVMQNGEIVEDGPVAQVFAAPQHSYTRRLLAAAPVLPDMTAEDDTAGAPA
ncbi:ABC transporter ATP-binding protein [Tritonibacter horizontis]|uniref:Glutathione import ATP-binding protein GsiA n=1 Tax=Tritonibacter horizontis TaxID=1768241 RepID=A0A132C176_9RHOB|nr:ABC transporter ATP-binding protein [Tritonibacter horizontis]KUP94321.1 glutathione import ATP-binding protein GsiA [Tritonibacter horizontis]